MKIRELFMGEKQVILKLREDGKSISVIAQTLAIASTTIWNVLKKKERQSHAVQAYITEQTFLLVFICYCYCLILEEIVTSFIT